MPKGIRCGIARRMPFLEKEDFYWTSIEVEG